MAISVLTADRRRDERGVGIVTVLMIALTVFALGAVWLTFGVHQVQASGRERLKEQARNAAEAGVNFAMSQLAGNKTYAGTSGTVTTLNDGTGEFEVKVGPAGFDPNARYIVARGYSPSRTSPSRVARQLEQQVSLVPLDGFRYGLFSMGTGIAAANNVTVIGDVYSKADLVFANQTTVAGSVWSQGSVSTSNQSTISGDIHAKGTVTINDAKTTVTGNVFSNSTGAPAVSLTGIVKGNVQAAGTISGGTVTGSRTQFSDPPPPPDLALPAFTWNPANYTNPMTWADAGSFNTYFQANSAAFSGAHRVNCTSCTNAVSLKTSGSGSSWTMTDDTTIVADGPVNITSDINNSSGHPVTLTVVSNATGSSAIALNTQLTLPADIRVLLFAPNGCISFNQLKNFTGVVYAKCITIGQNFTLTYFPVKAPGFTWDLTSASHYKVQSVAFKEVPYRAP